MDGWTYWRSCGYGIYILDSPPFRREWLNGSNFNNLLLCSGYVSLCGGRQYCGGPVPLFTGIMCFYSIYACFRALNLEPEK